MPLQCSTSCTIRPTGSRQLWVDYKPVVPRRSGLWNLSAPEINFALDGRLVASCCVLITKKLPCCQQGKKAAHSLVLANTDIQDDLSPENDCCQ